MVSQEASACKPIEITEWTEAEEMGAAKYPGGNNYSRENTKQPFKALFHQIRPIKISQILTDESSTEAEVAAENEPLNLNKEDKESNCSNDTEDEFMAENVQTFKNMAYLQR